MISLRVWDIGGQSMNSRNLPEYLASSNVVFMVYDVTNPESFQNLDDWVNLVKRHSPRNTKISLVGNKVGKIVLMMCNYLSSDRYDWAKTSE